MDADEFRDYILGFIFYKYLSEHLNLYADDILKTDELLFAELNEADPEDREILKAVEENAIEALGYFLKPSELFSSITAKGAQQNTFILADLSEILNNIQKSTMGPESEDDFDHLFEDLDLTSTKIGRSEEAKNALITKVLGHLDAIDFQLEEANSDVLGPRHPAEVRRPRHHEDQAGREVAGRHPGDPDRPPEPPRRRRDPKAAVRASGSAGASRKEPPGWRAVDGAVDRPGARRGLVQDAGDEKGPAGRPGRLNRAIQVRDPPGMRRREWDDVQVWDFVRVRTGVPAGRRRPGCSSYVPATDRPVEAPGGAPMGPATDP